MSDSTLGIIRILAGLIVLLLIQPYLSRLKSPVWGCIIPVVILAVSVYAVVVLQTPVTTSSVVLVVVLLLWTLLDWYRGRQSYRAKANDKKEKER